MPGRFRAHYRGTYARRARAVVAQANADPTARCWRCGRLSLPGDPWQAGHIRDTDPTSPLAAEHRSCNALAGTRLKEPRSQRW